MPRPKRPVRPVPPPPPLPPVVTPEDLDAVNTPEIDETPAYISPGKFQWKPPLPGPKGDQGEPGAPGEPGATVRPITPPVTTDEIANGAVTPPKLSFVPVARPLVPPVTTEEIGVSQVTPDKLSFVPVARPITPPVTTDEIADDSITNDKIDSDAVMRRHIRDGHVSPPKLDAIDSPADGEVPVYNLAQGKFEWVGAPAAVGRFVPRRVTGADWTHTVLTKGAWIVDGLDLTGIVPSGAIAVVIAMHGACDPPGDIGIVVPNQVDAWYNEAKIISQVGNMTGQGSFILPIDPDRLMDYNVNVNVTWLDIMVVGWFI